MNKKEKDFTRIDLGLISAVLPIIGFMMVVYYWRHKNNKELGKYLLVWSIVGLIIEFVVDFLFKLLSN